ncbi:hypothetical protein CDL15_Pgr005378 [Punica granatum]|uniref:HAT C-terminal dimerisation domain-containing protein n=1 Tax=Punica granatum TaxID=22663 RepID=A0A218XDU8_PUNGR|nr:hypothetical protein CDL15_Pgr005378 [Punica granatum]
MTCLMSTIKKFASAAAPDGAVSAAKEDAGTEIGDVNLPEDYKALLSREPELHPRKSELDCYLEEPRIDYSNKKMGILDYWQSDATTCRYPVLAAMARDVLAVPVARVGAESSFSIPQKIA